MAADTILLKIVAKRSIDVQNTCAQSAGTVKKKLVPFPLKAEFVWAVKIRETIYTFIFNKMYMRVLHFYLDKM